MKRWLTNRLLKYLFNAITEDDILRFVGQSVTLRGRALTQNEVAELKSGAETIQRLEMWRLVVQEMQHRANEMIFTKSQTLDDLIFPKAVLYTVDVMEKTLKRIANIK